MVPGTSQTLRLRPGISTWAEWTQSLADGNESMCLPQPESGPFSFSSPLTPGALAPQNQKDRASSQMTGFTLNFVKPVFVPTASSQALLSVFCS